MVKPRQTTHRHSRGRNDTAFFLTLSVLGGTYVLLIVLLLLADVAYLFRTPTQKEVFLDFVTPPTSANMNPSESRAGQFPEYGLSITAGTTHSVPKLWNTNRPNGFPQWGTPHVEYGGPGTGQGGDPNSAIPNNRPLGNILVPPENPPPSSGRLNLHWNQPVRLQKLICLADTSPVELILEDIHGNIRTLVSNPGSGPGSIHVIALPGEKLTDAQIVFPQGGGLAEMRFAWAGRIWASWELQYPWLSRVLYNPMVEALAKPEIQYSLSLSLISCTVTAIISLWIAVPLGYLLSRCSFFGKGLVDAILDIPIVLPPLVVGLSLLILFQFMPAGLRDWVVYQIPAVILAQVAVACAFAVRTMKAAFDQIDPRCEQVALTLGCSRAAAFSRVVLPEAVPGMLTAGTLAWARALGEFGPLLIFAGATRHKTEVLSTSVFLELSVGDLSAAVSISLIMVVAAVIVLVLTRIWGTKTISL